MKKLKLFFWLCSGADRALLEKCPTESSKYVGIGATIFFTGLFASISGAYALWTVFEYLYTAIAFGLVWGLLIFNLDRYIVSSMRKEGNFLRELMMASPRILLAVLISIVIAKPLELKIFDKEIQPELAVMEQEAYARQENQLRTRSSPVQDSLKSIVNKLKEEINVQRRQRDALTKRAQEEADGTGGSKKKNLGPIYKIKKADADRAAEELLEVTTRNGGHIRRLNLALTESDSSMLALQQAIVRSRIDGPAARMEALSRLTKASTAILWAHYFIILLFMAIETSPVLVKLISIKGPYDNLLRMEEHGFAAAEIEKVAVINANAKENTASLPQRERDYTSKSLDAFLK
jgi:hypothetical protein